MKKSSRRRTYQKMKRRGLIAGVVGGIPLAALGVKESFDLAVNVLDEVEDGIDPVDGMVEDYTLSPGEAVNFLYNGEEYIVGYTPGEDHVLLGEAGEVERAVPENLSDIGLPYGTIEVENFSNLDGHLDVGDVITGGDVIEPRGNYGVRTENRLYIDFSEETGILESGEHEEVFSNYTGARRSRFTPDNIEEVPEHSNQV